MLQFQHNKSTGSAVGELEGGQFEVQKAMKDVIIQVRDHKDLHWMLAMGTGKTKITEIMKDELK